MGDTLCGMAKRKSSIIVSLSVGDTFLTSNDNNPKTNSFGCADDFVFVGLLAVFKCELYTKV